MASVLVTGGLGFIGAHLCTRLHQDGHAVIALDTACCRESGLPYWVWPKDIVTLAQFWEAQPFDCVIHLAANAGVRASLADPAGYARTNVEGTTRVLECARTAGVSRIIFASSSSVYGHPERPERASCETDPVYPLSPYGVTKVAGELLCQTYAALYGMDITALRLFSVYGPRQRPDLVLPTFARQMLAGEPVQVFGDGTTLRDYTYIEDIVEGMCLTLARLLAVPRPHGTYTCYNLGSGTPIAMATLITTLQAALHLPRSDVIYGPSHAADALCTHADIRKARAVLGYAPQVSFAEGVQRYVAWLRVVSPARRSRSHPVLSASAPGARSSTDPGQNPPDR